MVGYVVIRVKCVCVHEYVHAHTDCIRSLFLKGLGGGKRSVTRRTERACFTYVLPYALRMCVCNVVGLVPALAILCIYFRLY